jgi:hypothetical protein
MGPKSVRSKGNVDQATAWYFNDTFAYDTCINGKLNYAFYVYGIHTYALYFYW